jgi:hypothetical protein
MTAARHRGERGTAALEVAGMAPMVVFVIFLLIQAAMALYAITTAQTAVRQAARAYSQGESSPYSVVSQSVPGWIKVAHVDLYGQPGHGVRATFDIPDVIPFYDLRITRETVMP